MKRVAIYDRNIGDYVCSDCIRAFYADILPGIVKHGTEDELTDWLRRNSIRFREVTKSQRRLYPNGLYCDSCGDEVFPPHQRR